MPILSAVSELGMGARINKGAGGVVAYHVGAPPAAIPKTPPKKRVVLKANRRPTISLAIPQKLAPIVRPMKVAKVVKRTFVELIPNS